MATRAVFYFVDDTYYSLAGTYSMRKLMEIKGDIQELRGKKVVGHRIEFLSLVELEREYWTVRPLR